MLKLQNTVCLIGTSLFYKLFMHWWECLCDMADPGIEEWKGCSGLHMCSCGFNCYWCSGWFICSWRIAACINYWSCSVTFGLVRLIQCTIYASEDFDLQWFHAFFLWVNCQIHIKWHIHWVALYVSDWLHMWDTIGACSSLHIICIQFWISYQTPFNLFMDRVGTVQNVNSCSKLA